MKYNLRMIPDSNTLLLITGAAVVLLLLFILRLEIRLRRLCKGASGTDLEAVVKTLNQKNAELERNAKETDSYLKSVEHRLSRSIQGVDTVRFNAFKGTGDGGNQSFATAFVDEKGNGIIISTLYSRDRTSVFAKPLKAFKTAYELTEEEKEALKKARQNSIS